MTGPDAVPVSHALAAPGGVLVAYEGSVAAGRLADDPAQRRVARRLDALARALAHYRPAARPQGLFRLLGNHRTHEPPRGVYVHGAVGRGKTMLMDLFHAAAPIAPKRRVHFLAFMQDVHERIHRHRQAQRKRRSRDGDPIPPVARALSEEAALLCFDEFQVSDIADAMVLGRLFEALFANGVVVVATSNQAPEDLYEDGLNRGLFLPFIDMLRQRLDVVSLDGDTDYRQGHAVGESVYVTPLGEEASRRLEALWLRLAGGCRGGPRTLALKGRELIVPQAACGMARFRFADLCERPLGPADFLMIARTFDTVFVEDIPVLAPERRNEALRLITLIDTLYDNGVRLVASAAADPDRLYRAGDHAEAFERTASRLAEMQSADYWAGLHGPVNRDT